MTNTDLSLALHADVLETLRSCAYSNLDHTLMYFSISSLNGGAYRVADSMGRHVGNLKFILGLWKFKAIGYDDYGEVIPGGGFLTERHNTVFSSLDIEHINRVLEMPPHL